jgi:hypothetical protein
MKFDVAITAETEKEGGGSAKGGVKGNIQVLAFEASLGGEGKLSSKNETVSRIQFPIHFRLDTGKMPELETRLERIEKRLDLTDPAIFTDSP